MKTDDEKVSLIYDVKLHRPACVLIQAAAGCGRVQDFFDAVDWLDFPTPGMKRLMGTMTEWRELAKLRRLAAD